MKTKLLFLLFLASLPSFAQYTLIPDVNFENRLIGLGIDTDGANGKVLTSSISSVTSLNLYSFSISDLTGIQDFTALTTLDCRWNQLTNLDISKNTALKNLICSSNPLTNLDVSNNIALTNLSCRSNQLTTLDISKNTALTNLDCSSNQLTNLDVSKCTFLTQLSFFSNLVTNLDVSNNTALKHLLCQSNQLTNLDVSNNTALLYLSCSSNTFTTLDVSNNTALNFLYCNSNQLTNLDVSKNIALTDLDCGNNLLTTLDVSKNVALRDITCSINQLTSLNLKNGNNTILSSSNGFGNNPNLTCIQVDDVDYSNTNWAVYKDATASYSTNCPSLGTTESVFNTIAVYPNPVKGDLHIDNSILEKATVYDALGKLVKTKTFANGSNSNSINLAGLSSGIYYIYLESQGATIVKKIVVD